MKSIRFLLAAAAVAWLSPAAFADDTDRSGELPEHISVRDLTYGGTGCPAGSMRGAFEVAGTDFLVVWDSFSAAAGPGIPLRDARKNCQLLLALDHTPGWQFGVESIEYHGKAVVAEGSEAVVGSLYYIQGDAETLRFTTLFEGPVRRRFQIRDTVGDDERIWSPCDASRALNVNFQVRISNAAGGASEGEVYFGGTGNAPAGALVRLVWRRCAE